MQPFVHEDLTKQHTQGQAKFLEQPTKEKHGDLARTIARDVKSGIGLKLANKNAAVELLKASQELVPVDTGALKASGYVRDESGNTVYGSSETPEEILAWQKLLKGQQRLQQHLQQGNKTG